MRVTLIGSMIFHSEAAERTVDRSWSAEDDTDSSLIEFAGRGCYESWSRPNPATATNAGYIGHIIEVDHGSVLEHGVVSVRVQDCSRSFTHELVRHRHLSYSQLSQRFARLRRDISGIHDYVCPPVFVEHERAREILTDQWISAVSAYHSLMDIADEIVDGTDTRAKKRAREAARAVLPNMTPTSIVVTGNHRAWREVLEKRGSAHADAEIREFALQMFEILTDVAPNVYQDFSRIIEPDGTVVLSRRG